MEATNLISENLLYIAVDAANGITLGQTISDPINRMITLTGHFYIVSIKKNVQIFGGTSRFRGTQVEKHCSKV